MIAAVLGIFGAIGLSILCALLVGEVKAWARRFAQTLIAHAVARLPEAYQERFKDEWLGDVEYLQKEEQVLGQLMYALRVWSRVPMMNGEFNQIGPEVLSNIELLRRAIKVAQRFKTAMAIEAACAWFPIFMLVSRAVYLTQFDQTASSGEVPWAFVLAIFISIAVRFFALEVAKRADRQRAKFIGLINERVGSKSSADG